MKKTHFSSKKKNKSNCFEQGVNAQGEKKKKKKKGVIN